MTDTNLPTPEVHDCPAEGLREEIRNLRRQLSSLREGLESGLREVDDTDDQDRLKDFLETNTPWEFDLDTEFRVEIRGWVLVTARNSNAAEELVDNADWSFSHREVDIEVDSFEVRQVIPA